jgi:hypothetical protein
MVNIITGLIAIVLIIAFLGNYAIKVGSIALSIIIVITLAMVCYDFVQSLRNESPSTRCQKLVSRSSYFDKLSMRNVFSNYARTSW